MSRTTDAFRHLERDPDALEAVLHLGVTDGDGLAQESRADLATVARTARDQMVQWSLADGLPEGVEENLAYFLAVFGSHYVAAVSTLVERQDEHLSAALSLPLSIFAEFDRRRQMPSGAVEGTIRETQNLAADAVGNLFSAWLAIALVRYARTDDDPGHRDDVRAEAVKQMFLLYEFDRLLERAKSPLALFTASVSQTTAVAAIKALEAHPPRRRDISAIGFGALDPVAIEPLARRSPKMRQEYGTTIERAFERQLALLFTSFGYAVIESSPGQRQVDLLCVAASPEPASFLVEAKTTRAAEYGFPAAHQRALSEHVDEVKRSLRGLPPLRMILVVAPSFSAGSAKRLSAVGRERGVGCHGLPAHLLSILRLGHLGEVPFDVLSDEILQGPTIITEEVVQRILRITRAPGDAWREFVSVQRRARARPSGR